MARAWSPCTKCATPVPPGQGRCQPCTRTADQARGSRGYSTRGHRLFREAVLARDPLCKVCHQAWSTIADHYPHSRKDLLDLSLDPNEPTRGRGLCKPCHDRETALHQAGGWNSD